MKTKRIPRPTGTTFLSQRYNQTQTNEDKEKLIDHIISQYTIQGFRLNHRSMDIHQLAKTIQITPNEIMRRISESSKNLGYLLDPDSINQTLKTIVGTSLTWAFQDRGLVMSQLETLLRAQDGNYKPFISSEVNKNLKILLESNKGLQEAYKSFFNQQNNITNILNIQDTDKEENKYLSPEEAVKMLKQGESTDDAVRVSELRDSEIDQIALNNGVSTVGEEKQWGFGISADESRRPESPEALGNQSPFPAKRPPRLNAANATNQHESFELRRGEEEDETDTLPNRSND